MPENLIEADAAALVREVVGALRTQLSVSGEEEPRCRLMCTCGVVARLRASETAAFHKKHQCFSLVFATARPAEKGDES